jgi:putative salt-induced outer membrane protein YdiY
MPSRRGPAAPRPSHLLLLLGALAAPAAGAQSTPAGAPTDAATRAEAAAQAAQAAAEASRRAAETTERLARTVERLVESMERQQQHAQGASAGAATPATPATPAAAAVTAAPVPTSAEAAAAAAAAPVWQGAVGLGLIALTGNSSTVTFNGLGTLERRSEDWVFNARAFGTYGQSRAAGEDLQQTVASAAGLRLRGDRRITATVSGYLLGGVEMDRIKSVEARLIGEGGLGLIWVDAREGSLERTFFRTDLAFRAAQENRFQYFPERLDVPDALLLAPRLGLTYRHALNENVTFSEDAELLPNVIGAERLVLNSLTKLTARLVEKVSLGVSLLMQYDSQPAPERVPLDTALSVGVELGL